MTARKRLPNQADVIVIGAGAAGVFAMRELVRRGLSVIGIEARNRIGGRVFTRRSLSRSPIELGAEFVHGRGNITERLAREYGLTLAPHLGTAWVFHDGRLRPETDLPKPSLEALREIRSIAERFRREGRGEIPLARFLDDPEPAAVLAESDVTRRYIEQLIKNDSSVEPTALSLEGWLEPDVSGYEDNFRIVEGYSTLLQRAAEAEQLDVRLNRPLQRIEWEPGAVTCFARNLVVRSRAVVVTLPLGVLQKGQVEFDPPLPTSKIEAIDVLLPGKALKMVTSYRPMHGDESFWPEGMSFVASTMDSQLHWPTLSTDRSGKRLLLTHLVGGDAADRFGHDPDPPHAMLNQLVHMFGQQRIRRLFIRAEWRLWHEDPFCYGGYSAFSSETDNDARQTLGAPLSETLFFAGEAVGVREAPGKIASVHGAIESGIQAANDVAASLDR